MHYIIQTTQTADCRVVLYFTSRTKLVWTFIQSESCINICCTYIYFCMNPFVQNKHKVFIVLFKCQFAVALNAKCWTIQRLCAVKVDTNNLFMNEIFRKNKSCLNIFKITFFSGQFKTFEQKNLFHRFCFTYLKILTKKYKLLLNLTQKGKV